MGEKNLRWFPLVVAVFVTTLIISNIIAVKILNIFGLFLPAGVILFPVTYIFGDILTEVYGYGRARQVIWTGFFCNFLAVLAIWLAGALPAASFWSAGSFQTPQEAQIAYESILGFTPRLLLASFIAYLAGEFINSFVLAKLKLRTRGKFLWVRTIGSTVVGQGVDSLIFILIAFGSILQFREIQLAVLSQWFFKVVYETAATPITYLIVDFLKKSEGTDVFDRDTDFNPFRWKSRSRN